jgi:hypothetical protein
MENAHARKWPMYLGIGAGSVTVAGFAFAAMTGNVSWVLVLLITCIVGIEMAVTSVFTLKSRPKNPEVIDPVLAQADNVEQIAVTIGESALTAEEIANLPHIVVKTENSVPKIDSMKLANSMANSTGGIYIDSIDLVRQQLSQLKVPKQTKTVSKNEREKTKVKKKIHESKRKEKVKPQIKNTRRKIARLVKPTARA